jgi:hypothetical protein
VALDNGKVLYEITLTGIERDAPEGVGICEERVREVRLCDLKK